MEELVEHFLPTLMMVISDICFAPSCLYFCFSLILPLIWFKWVNCILILTESTSTLSNIYFNCIHKVQFARVEGIFVPVEVSLMTSTCNSSHTTFLLFFFLWKLTCATTQHGWKYDIEWNANWLRKRNNFDKLTKLALIS